MRPIRYSDEMIGEFRRDGYWTDEVFYDFWAKNAREIGDREALVDSRYRVTWVQAKRLVDNLAYAWVEMGIPKDSRMIIQAPNSVFGFIARIACERAGLISLTVYPYLREKELTFMVERTEAVAVAIPHIYRKFNYLEMYKELRKTSPYLKHFFLFEEEIPASTPEGTSSIIKLANQPVSESKLSILDKRRFNAYHDVGLLTSTTGTTGLPKLVEWPIAPRVCTSKSRVDIWNLTKDDVTLALAPHAGGAAGTLTYFAAPLVGAKTALMEEFDPEGALALIEKEEVTAIGVVPTHLVRMLEVNEKKYDLSSLRFIRSAGGYLSPQVAEEAEKRYKAIITSDLGTQDVGSVSGCSVDDPAEVRRRTVGRMLPGNKVRLLSDNGKDVPEREPGTLWFRGPHAPAGYYRDPEATAQVFNKDGWTTTGDIVKLEEGFLWIMGRAKDMIIRGGQNIYPAEIEGILNEHPKVTNVAIIGYPDKEMGERACAFIVVKPGETFTKDEMISFLKEKKLAAYKLPERFEILDSLPFVGDSGKVDKKALKAALEKKVAGA